MSLRAQCQLGFSEGRILAEVCEIGWGKSDEARVRARVLLLFRVVDRIAVCDEVGSPWFRY